MKPSRASWLTNLAGGRPLSRDKADTLLLLGACALILLPHFAHLPLWVSPVCVVLLSWRGWVTFRGSRMPQRWILIPIAVLAMAGVFATFKTFFGREAGVAMLALLLALKTLEMHAKRDLFVVLFLGFFLILSSFFYSQSIGTAVLTVAAIVTMLTTQVSFQYSGTVPPLWQRLRLGITILTLAVPLTLVLFLLFPRIQGPLWGLPGDAHAGRTGLSGSMSPGNIASLAQSSEIAFHVRFDGDAPDQSLLYWRALVLGNYDGRTWRPLPLHGQAERRVAVAFRGKPVRYQVTLEPNHQRWLFALDIPDSVPVIASNPVRMSYDMEMQARDPVITRLRYDATSRLDFNLHPNESMSVLRQWLKLPYGFNPRSLAYAARLRQQSENPAELVNIVLRHFREEKFRYTLEPPPLGTHVVDEFLFDTRAGFCEHYAGAFVVLMRAVGIPARVVTGYQGGEFNPADGYMAVRQSDAHAWAEVWLKERGWVRVDPTAAVAPDRIERNLESVFPRRMLGGLFTLDPRNNVLAAQWLKLRQTLDAVNNAWNQWVLNYTPEKQRDFFRLLGFKHVDWHTMTLVMFALGFVAVGAVVFPLLSNRKKRAPHDALYDMFCQIMSRRGLPRSIHEGPRAYRDRLVAGDSPLSPSQKSALASFLELYEAMRYGSDAGKKLPSSEIAKLKSLLAQCR